MLPKVNFVDGSEPIFIYFYLTIHILPANDETQIPIFVITATSDLSRWQSAGIHNVVGLLHSIILGPRKGRARQGHQTSSG